jgi:hypothetical protein
MFEQCCKDNTIILHKEHSIEKDTLILNGKSLKIYGLNIDFSKTQILISDIESLTKKIYAAIAQYDFYAQNLGRTQMEEIMLPMRQFVFCFRPSSSVMNGLVTSVKDGVEVKHYIFKIDPDCGNSKELIVGTDGDNTKSDEELPRYNNLEEILETHSHLKISILEDSSYITSKAKLTKYSLGTSLNEELPFQQPPFTPQFFNQAFPQEANNGVEKQELPQDSKYSIGTTLFEP